MEIEWEFDSPAGSSFQPSKYQDGIFNWIAEGKGGARVNAVAGSGKTTTLVEVASRANGTSLFCAFNKHIEQELSERLPQNTKCRTIHSLGFQAVRNRVGNVKVDNDKYSTLCGEHTQSIRKKSIGIIDAVTKEGKIRRLLNHLVSMSMMTMTDAKDMDALKEMASMYQISIPSKQRELFFKKVPKIISKGVDMTADGLVSFNDMIYYPAIHDLNMPEYMWLMVDEAQDLSAAQLAIVSKSMKKRGRMVAVGDPFQSLYGFSGANPWSFQEISKFAQTDLPLSVCYRCSTSIVDLAASIVPQIEAYEKSPVGNVENIEEHEMFKLIQQGDMVVSRINAPLVLMCIKAIKKGYRAFVRGRDLMTSFVSAIEDIKETAGYRWTDFKCILLSRKMNKMMACEEEGEFELATAVKDLYEAVEACYDEFNCRDENQLINKIKDIFTEGPDSIVFSSIHRAKGLEAGRVFVLRPDIIRLKWEGQLDWQEFQEQCCEYVAITRAKERLFFVREPSKPAYKTGNSISLPVIP